VTHQFICLSTSTDTPGTGTPEVGGLTTREAQALLRGLDGLVPSVSVTETQPAGKTFQQWMLTQLDGLAAALEGKGQ
jgi:arginase family enzyme